MSWAEWCKCGENGRITVVSTYTAVDRMSRYQELLPVPVELAPF